MNKKIVLAIFISALLFRVIFALIIPNFEKPDEKAHYEYIKFLEENNRLPVQQEGQHNAEFFQPPFYHVMAAIALKAFNLLTQNEQYEIFFLRLLSVITSIFTLYFVYKISSTIFKNKNINLGVLIFAAFLPSHINMNSTITNANFGDFLSTFIIYLLASILSKGENKNKILLIGIAAGISLITRLSLIPILATIPITFIIRYHPNIKNAVNIKKIAKYLVIIGFIALLFSGWHLLRNFNLYGDFLGVNAMKLASQPDDITVDGAFIARLLGWTFATFWASFGRTNGIFVGNLNSVNGIIIFALFYSLLLILAIFALYGLYKFFKKYKKDKSLLIINQTKIFLMLIIHLIILILFFIHFNLYDFQPQGRLFFPAISTIAILFTLGIYNNFAEKNWARILIFYLAFFILIDLASITSILHYYSNF